MSKISHGRDAANDAGISVQFSEFVQRFDKAIERVLPKAGLHPAKLHESMHHATHGGKRLRALIVYASGEAVGADLDALDAPACAVELIHAYSLVHDDLPCMDDDDLRRGMPTVHKKYGEATAVLAGDALQTLAFQIISQDSRLDAEQRIRMIQSLATAAGSRGMVGGQAIDLASEGKQLSLAELEALHIHKTGALISACTHMAGLSVAGLADSQAQALDHFGKCIGLAFQIQDDVLDIESNTPALGKTAGKDEASQKCTYPSLMGLPAAKARARELFKDARDSLDCFGNSAQALLRLSQLIEIREH